MVCNELDLVGYKGNIGATEVVQQIGIMFLHFHFFIALSLITFDEDVEIIKFLDALDVGNLGCTMSKVLKYLEGMVGVGHVCD